ncbi:MAG: hypothetical protein O9302_09415, partial [Cyclobacteriaceae bacterium]|nr:hypothetical protein [Cytophagales bacterium]MCZ8328263.1 hypothetical protein [Cyclobacteriaceae bacterium]
MKNYLLKVVLIVMLLVFTLKSYSQCRITKPATVCTNQQIQFFVTGCEPGISTYWLINNQRIDSGSELNHTFTVAGQYTVQYVIENEECVQYTEPDIYPPQVTTICNTVTSGASTTVMVSVSAIKPQIHINKEFICSPQSINLSVTNTQSGVSYSWNSNPTGFASSGTSLVANNVLNTTIFTVSATLGNCVTTSTKTVTFERTTSVPQLNPEVYYQKRFISGVPVQQHHYWQTNPNGTDLANELSAIPLKVIDDNFYYLRKYSPQGNCWAVASAPLVVTQSKIPPSAEVSIAPKVGHSEVYLINEDIDHILQFADYFIVTGPENIEINNSIYQGIQLPVNFKFFVRGRDKKTKAWGSITELNIKGRSDDVLNWISTETFSGESSNVVTQSESKVYFDEIGKRIQTQTKLISDNHILVSQSVNDRYDREVLQALPAPLNLNDFSFQSLFITSTLGESYSYKDFDLPATQEQISRVINPLPVSKEIPNTLGWYYSDQNKDKTIPRTQYPYSRIEYYEDGTGEAKRSSSVGDYHRMGSGHEVHQATFPIRKELDHYLSIRKLFIPSQDSEFVTLANQGLISLNVDENGKSTFSFTDKNSKLLMNARPGNWLTITDQVAQITPQNPRQYLYATSNSSLNQVSANSISITKMRTEEALHANTTLTNIPVEQ